MKILNGKEAEKFIKKLYEINQIMKGIYKDLPNFSPVYVLTDANAYYFDEDCIPEYLKYNIDEPFDAFFEVVIDSKVLFDFFKVKENKDAIDSIEIDVEKVTFKSKQKILLELDYNKTIVNNMADLIKKYDNNYNKEILIGDVHLSKDIIKDMYGDNNKLMRLILDIDNDTVVYEKDYTPTDDSSFMKLFLNKKFFNGIYYKVKKLKKGDVEEYSDTTIDVHETVTNDTNYEVTFSVNIKNNDIIEHHFIMCDF